MQLPFIPTHCGQCSLRAVIEECVEVLVAFDQRRPFTGWVPGTPQRDFGIQRVTDFRRGDAITLSQDKRTDVAAVDDTRLRNFNRGKGGQGATVTAGTPTFKIREMTVGGRA